MVGGSPHGRGEHCVPGRMSRFTPTGRGEHTSRPGLSQGNLEFPGRVGSWVEANKLQPTQHRERVRHHRVRQSQQHSRPSCHGGCLPLGRYQVADHYYNTRNPTINLHSPRAGLAHEAPVGAKRNSLSRRLAQARTARVLLFPDPHCGSTWRKEATLDVQIVSPALTGRSSLRL